MAIHCLVREWVKCVNIEHGQRPARRPWAGRRAPEQKRLPRAHVSATVPAVSLGKDARLSTNATSGLAVCRPAALPADGFLCRPPADKVFPTVFSLFSQKNDAKRGTVPHLHRAAASAAILSPPSSAMTALTEPRRTCHLGRQRCQNSVGLVISGDSTDRTLSALSSRATALTESCQHRHLGRRHRQNPVSPVISGDSTDRILSAPSSAATAPAKSRRRRLHRATVARRPQTACC